MDIERTNLPSEKPSYPIVRSHFCFCFFKIEFFVLQTNRDSIIKQLDESYQNDRLPDTVIFLYTGIHQTNVLSIL
jgi:hypothetical protein